jgi:parvulin-like peptidyl-prolyl isomerase
MATEYLRQRIKPYVERPSHEQMLDYYEQHQSGFKVEDSVEWQDLFISTEKYKTPAEARKVAEDLVRRLRDGAEFVALCERYDDGLSRDRGGKGVGSRRGEIRPEELEDQLFRMRAGDVGPVVEIGSGFHVFRLVKRDYAGVKPFAEEEVQRMIRNKLRGEASARESKKMIADLKRKAVIEYARPRF